jgi:hypothetical protein
MRVSYFRKVKRNGVSALVKEAMSMRSSGYLLKRAGREFVGNLIWMAVVFGSLAVILVAATDLPLVGTMVIVGFSVAVLAAIVTVGALLSGAPDEWPPGGHDYPGSHPVGGGHWPGGWGDGGWGDGGGGDGGGGGV